MPRRSIDEYRSDKGVEAEGRRAIEGGGGAARIEFESEREGCKKKAKDKDTSRVTLRCYSYT